MPGEVGVRGFKGRGVVTSSPVTDVVLLSNDFDILEPSDLEPVD